MKETTIKTKMRTKIKKRKNFKLGITKSSMMRRPKNQVMTSQRKKAKVYLYKMELLRTKPS